MNQETEKLCRNNDRREHKLSRENRRQMERIAVYLRDKSVKDEDVEAIRRDIIDMLAAAEERGEGAESVIGSDYRAFCDEIRGSVAYKSEDSKMRENLALTFSFWPFIGLFTSVFSAFLGVVRGWSMSWETVLWTLVPFGSWTALFLILYAALRNRLDFELRFLKGKMKYATAALVVLYLVFMVMICF